MIKDIDKHLALIEQAIQWAKKYKKESFPFDVLKDYRRKLKKIKGALSENCSAAAYGESQVGKSYLMNSLLSSPDSPFVISNGEKSYSFIDQLNESGGKTSKIESTGVITRFTLNRKEDIPAGKVKISNLSVVDLILLLTDSYYNDIKINPETGLKYDEINQALSDIAAQWKGKPEQQTYINEDDIKDIADYIREIIGNNASNVCQSDFCKIVAPVISRIPHHQWVEVFSLLWNRNEEMSHLFSTLITAYKEIDFTTDICVPFEAVLKEQGTLLKIEWLDSVCGEKIDHPNDVLYTDVYDRQGKILARDFKKSSLSALIAEITFYLPEELAKDRKFLSKIDLLDFPGARSREKYKEQEIHSVLSKVLRRGKVAYLFNKYSRTLRISSVLFCHHNDQKTEPSIGETIHAWIEDNIGKTPKLREALLANTKGISPLFLIATKFNIDLERIKTDTPNNIDRLNAHWNRFDTVLPEIIRPYKWLEEWLPANSQANKPYFRNIYPLRDFYWSGKNQIFDGYSDSDNPSPETGIHVFADYPNYMENLKQSFLAHPFVQRHFAHPEATWESVATPNNDGSKAIIENLDAIAGVLDEARTRKYADQVKVLKKNLYDKLTVYYETEDKEEQNNRVKKIAGDIRRSLFMRVGEEPEIFGQIIDRMMIHPGQIRNIAYDIIVRHTDKIQDFSQIAFMRKVIGINPTDKREVNLQKLMDWGGCDVEQLEEEFTQQGFSVEDLIHNEQEELTTLGDVITKHIVEAWEENLNNQTEALNKLLPHADEVIFMLFNLLKKLNIKQQLAAKINLYITRFSEESSINAIADYASLALNNFISNVGRNYLTDTDLKQAIAKAETCHLKLDFSEAAWAANRQPQDLVQTLTALVSAQSIATVDAETLRKLPLWSNFQRWENLTLIGLLLVSDIAHFDPVANTELGELINICKNLYN